MNRDILIKMQITREIAAKGHKLRQEAGIPLKQPLQSITIDSKWINKRYKELWNQTNHQ